MFIILLIFIFKSFILHFLKFWLILNQSIFCIKISTSISPIRKIELSIYPIFILDIGRTCIAGKNRTATFVLTTSKAFFIHPTGHWSQDSHLWHKGKKKKKKKKKEATQNNSDNNASLSLHPLSLPTLVLAPFSHQRKREKIAERFSATKQPKTSPHLLNGGRREKGEKTTRPQLGNTFTQPRWWASPCTGRGARVSDDRGTTAAATDSEGRCRIQDRSRTQRVDY